MKFYYGKQEMRTLDRAQENCFLVTNGLGGYASVSAAYSVPRCDQGILVAAVMLILMMAGAAGLADANGEVAQMESYLAQLRDENLQLQQTYKESYDLEEIRMEALAMGMIPADRAETVTIQVQAPGAEPTEPHSFWAVLAGLFA